MNKTQKTALFSVLAGVGHVNACIALGQRLLDSGNYRVVFAVNEQWKGKLLVYGFEEIIAEVDKPDDSDDDDNNKKNSNPAKHFASRLLDTGLFEDKSPVEVLITVETKILNKLDPVKHLDKQLETVIQDIKPDVILLDQFYCLPSAELSGIPLVWIWSAGPLFINDDDRLPPSQSGYSCTSDEKLWQEFRKIKYNLIEEKWKEWNDYIISRGCLPLLRDHDLTTQHKWPTIYGFPKELDYTDIVPLRKNYIPFDNLMRREVNIEKFEIPEQLRDKPGKLIYFSLGSMGAVNVDNMKRLVAILAKSMHRFIVSKGPLGDEYELPDNMWGQSTVPQVSVLPLVDLVITHGGNNTTTETFNYGKPMIVLPLFADQFDNAQRVQDLGLGIRLNAYKCTDEELLTAIEKLLNDNELNEKLQKISQRIQSDNSLDKFPQIIDNYLKDPSIYL
ncbi:NDP-glycosyltransferase YjiC-like [Oppia nitens]|uniref:NDP-glycosyltransferase YjiC-like n=1 Tax=Oppia nitens TaxID=1686743 RepID=UPI0023DC177F|nr:NDP-glycosyltransferase YjiC-like [Oppia nitens]